MAVEYFQISEGDRDMIEQLLALEEECRGGRSGLMAFDVLSYVRYGRVYAAVEYDEILGSVTYIKDFDNSNRVFLNSITIKPSESGKGLAESLLLSTFTDLKDSNLRMVEAMVHRSNQKAVRTYTEKLGFHAINMSDEEEYDDVNYLILRKLL